MEIEIATNAKDGQKEQSRLEGEGMFRDQFGTRFINVTESTGETKVMVIDSDAFKRYLRRQFYLNNQVCADEKMIRERVKTLDAVAEGAPMYLLHQRIAQAGDVIYYDLADNQGRIVEVTATGWKVITKAPVRFRHKGDAAQQVMPVRASAETAPSLFEFVNIQDPADQLLFEVSFVTCLIPEIAHPIISLIAGEGSAKTTVSRVLKSLIDPAAADLIKFPANELDLGIACSRNHLVAFDNMTHVSQKQSDLLCQVVTGGNICVRKLYTTDDMVTIPLQSCLVFNGIDISGKGKDLLDRTIVFHLPKIEKSRRKDEREFWLEFNAAKPLLLGRYFDILSQAIRAYPDMKPGQKPRMADYFRWGLAVAKALGRDPEEFARAYQANVNRIVQESIEQDPLAAAISVLVDKQKSWEGTFAELHTVLVRRFGSQQLPKAPNQLSRELKRICGTLDKAGVAVTWGKNHAKNLTTVRLTKVGKSSPASPDRRCA